MKRSNGFLLGFAIAAIALASVVFERTYDVAVSVYQAVREGIKFAFLRAVDVVATSKVEINRPEAQRVQAKAYQARQEKRERPTLTPGWRMCPSI